VSYDLNFHGANLDLDEVREWLTDANHELDDAGTRCGYEDATTGVYWNFSFDDAANTFAFNMNYYRPHTFGLEAETVLTALVGRFALHVHDPQSSGMGDGPYTPAGFLRGWNAGNEFAHRAIAQSEGFARPYTRFAETNEAVWRWNFAKAGIADDWMDDEDDLQPFFPTAMTLLEDGKPTVKTCVIWGFDIDIAIPRFVDLVVSSPVSGEGLIAAPRDGLAAFLEAHSTWPASHTVGYAPRAIGTDADRFTSLSAVATHQVRSMMKPFVAKRIATDQILDTELVTAAIAAGK
jgi:hypothetical protein